MMSKQQLSMVEATLPPGFRFHPRDHELICDYLSNKVHLSQYSSLPLPLLLEVDLNKCEPWDLPESCCVGGKEWYLYSQRDRKYATGLRTNRATVSGYWKATGKDRCIHDKHKRKEVVGMRKTLVFYLGRAPKGKKTDWVMHEFRLPDSTLKEDWVLCRVFCKNREAIDNKERHDQDQDQDQDQDMTSSVSCGSSSLPPLMNMNMNMNMMFSEQVPCFSNPPVPDPKPFSNTSNYISPSNCCQKKDIFKSILSRFNMTDNHHSMLSFGTEGHQEQSFLSDVALPVTMWYP